MVSNKVIENASGCPIGRFIWLGIYAETSSFRHLFFGIPAFYKLFWFNVSEVWGLLCIEIFQRFYLTYSQCRIRRSRQTKHEADQDYH